MDNTFDAITFISYHSEVGSCANPLAHTINDEKYYYIKINNKKVSELDIATMAANYFKVPIIFVPGDKGLVENNKHTPFSVTTIEGVCGATVMLLSCEEAQK